MTIDAPMTRGLRASGAAAPAGAIAVLLVALVYYARYLACGLNLADDGHYAQVAYELLLGTDPHALRFGYGLLWFKIGQGLFALTGPSWLTMQLFFHGLIVGTALLVYATVQRVAGSTVLALLGAGVAVAVPAFPPTVFYAACVLLNVFLQVRTAERWRAMTPGGLLAPAAGLSLTFQIRPDFGFVFSATLFGLILLGALSAGTGTRGAGRRFARLTGAALAAFAAAQAPLLLLAASGGYLDLILNEYLRYPQTLLHYLATSVGSAPAAGGGTDGGAGTLLRRPPLPAVWRWASWREPGGEAAMALLVHLPPAVIAGFALVTALRLRRARDAGRVPVLLVVLGGALAALPHYYLFRPDLSHVANFMAGYVVLVCVLAAELAVLVRRAGPAGRLGALLAGAVPAAGVAVYLWVGLTTPGTGSIAAAAGRTEPFTARNGVSVQLAPGERVQMEALRQAIEVNSRPGDRIVCVPFCPGAAFMTARRMLLRDWYVDDSFLTSDPGWIDRTIAQTREQRPPVVIVVDWAINGTEISRFQNWARRYVDVLEATARDRIVLPGITVYAMP